MRRGLEQPPLLYMQRCKKALQKRCERFVRIESEHLTERSASEYLQILTFTDVRY